MITDFLTQTRHSREDLKKALDVLKEFKGFENSEEFVGIPFIAWGKLEQLEEFLAHLVQEAPLHRDTLEYIESNATKN